MSKRSNTSMLIKALPVMWIAAVVLVPSMGHADFLNSLGQIKTVLTRFILPTLSVMGLGWASVSLYSGNPQGKTHVFYAILGCIFSLGAQSIVDLITSTVR